MNNYTFVKTDLGNYTLKLNGQRIGEILNDYQGWRLEDFNDNLDSRQQKEMWRQFYKQEYDIDFDKWLQEKA